MFTFTQVGYQKCFTDPKSIETLQQLKFDAHRLGFCLGDINQMEPVIRDADLLSFDLSAIRWSDLPAHNQSSPHGLYGEQACQLMRYAGWSDRLTSVGIYEFNPELDDRTQSAQLVAQMLWHFVEGFYEHKKEKPGNKGGNFLKYLVEFEGPVDELVFWKSRQTDRWWVEVPNVRLSAPYILPCSHEEYVTTCEGEMPDRWYKAFNKLN